MANTLWQLKRGESAVLEAFTEDFSPVYRARMMELGFHPGARVSCVVAPRMGAPKLFKVDNAVYSLEKAVASLITVQGAGV